MGASTSRSSRHGASRRGAGTLVGRPVDLADGEPRHLRRGGGAAEPEAAADQRRPCPRCCRHVAVRADRDRPGHLRLDVVAVEQLRRLGVERDVDAEALGRAEVEGAAAGDRAAPLGGAGEAVEHQPRAAEPAAARTLSITMPVTALSIRARSVRSEPRICGLFERAARVGADRDRAADVEQLDPGQPPQRVGRAVVAQLREHRRGAEPLADIAARADRREPRLRPADRLALADRDRAQRRIAAVELRRPARCRPASRTGPGRSG